MQLRGSSSLLFSLNKETKFLLRFRKQRSNIMLKMIRKDANADELQAAVYHQVVEHKFMKQAGSIVGFMCI
jgi:hypothetical protein